MKQTFMGWKAECQEWLEIRDELSKTGEPVTAYQVTLEQRKRMRARGQRPMTYKEILAEQAVVESSDGR